MAGLSRRSLWVEYTTGRSRGEDNACDWLPAWAAARAAVEAPLKSNQVRLDFGLRRFVRTEEMFRKELAVTGVVTERLLVGGEYVKGTPIVKVAQIHALRVEVIAPVALFGKITPDTRAEILPEAPVNGTYSAKVTVVDRVADAASGTFGVRLEHPNPGHKFPAGLKCKIRFPR